MSLAIKAGRAGLGMSARPQSMQMMGDPGLFGFLGKTIKGAAGIASRILPGPLGAAAGAISRIGGGGSRAPAMIATGAAGGALTATAIGRALQGPGRGGGGFRVPGTGVVVNPGDFFPGGAPFLSGAQGSAVGCPQGMRPNKTSYFLKSGEFVPEGSRCVKIRRRNNLNSRALTKALGRVEGFKKTASRASRITIRKPKSCR